MVRGAGSARAETSVKAGVRPSTLRIRMRGGPPRDTLDDLSKMSHLSIFRLARDARWDGTLGINSLRFAAAHDATHLRFDPFYLLKLTPPAHEERDCKRR